MSTLLFTSAIWAAVVLPAHAQFSMWPAVSPTQLATAMGFSVDCLDAMYVFLLPGRQRMCEEAY